MSMPRIFLSCLPFLWCLACFSQQGLAPDTLRKLYSESIGANALPYEGKQFYGYHPSITGSPFLHGNDWKTTSLMYRGNYYLGLQARFDLVGNRLILDHPILLRPLIPEPKWITEFEMQGVKYIRISSGAGEKIAEGFYEVLIEDSVSVLIRRQKKIERNPTPQGLEQSFRAEDSYYLVFGESFVEIGSRRNLLSAFPEHKPELKKLLRHKNLHFRRHPEATIKTAVNFINQTKRK